MTSIGQDASSSSHSSTTRINREIDTSQCLSPRCTEKTAKCSDAKSIRLRTSNISATTIQMYLRIRPTSAVTKKGDVYQILNPTTLLTKFPSFESNGRNSRSAKSCGTTGRRHAFTKIFGSETSQAEVFERSIKHRIADFLGGKSSTIMSYGTRDSGKTYTLLGTSASPGIILRSIELVFSAINCTLTPWYKPMHRDTVFSLDEATQTLEMRRKTWILNGGSMDANQISAEARKSLENSQPKNTDPEEREECNGDSLYAVWLSIAEIYNENVYDLLDDAEIQSPLKLTTDKKGRAYVCNLQEVYATTAFEACQILMMGQSRSRTAATPLNPSSSRSHTIFKMRLLKYEKERVADEVVVSSLTFCDLAGSTQFKTQREVSQVREASNISNSLLVLGRCLKAVSQNQTAPFRESKLTRMLQRALSGQENLTLVVNVIFIPTLYVETQNTFNFCVIVRKLQTESRNECKRSRELEETVHSLETYDNSIVASPPIHQISSETAETIDYIDSVTYENIQEQNRRLIEELGTTKSNIINREYAIRQELADHYTRMIKELEATYNKHAEEIETERHDLLRWSVKQVESFYKERIDSLMRHKKRKRGDSGDYIGDNHALYEELEAENAQITSKVVILKEAVKKLRKENKMILCEKNKCSFELALVTEELKKFRELTRAGIHKWGGNSENIEDNAACLMNNLERLMDERVRRIEKQLEETNEYVCAIEDRDIEAASGTAAMKQELLKSENLLDEISIKMKEVEEKLLQKEAYIVTLKHRVQAQERQLAEAQQCLNDTKTDDAKNRKYKCEKSTNISFDDCATGSFVDDNAPVSFAEKNTSQPYMISSTSQHEFANTITIPTLFATKTHEELSKKKPSDVSDIDRRSFYENSTDCSASRLSDRSSKDDSGISSGLRDENQKSISMSENTHIRESEDKCTQTCLVEEYNCTTAEIEQHKMNWTNLKRQNHKEMSHVSELSRELETIGDMIYALNEADCVNEHKITQHECQLLHKERALERLIEEQREAIKCNNLFKMIMDKMQEYKREICELTRTLAIKEQNEDKCLERYAERSKFFENELSLMRNELNEVSIKCGSEHLSRIESLEEEMLRKTLQMNELNDKIAQMQYKFARSFELFQKINNFEIVVDTWQREKNELYLRLYKCSETHLRLESELKKLATKVEGRGSEVCNVIDLNTTSNMETKNLSKQVTETDESTSLNTKDSSHYEHLHENVGNIILKKEVNNCGLPNYKNNTVLVYKFWKAYNDSQDKITRLNMQLRDKELEITLLKNTKDVVIQNYETLKRDLQDRFEEANKDFRAIHSDSSNNFERSLIDKNALCEAFERNSFNSLKKSIDDQRQAEQLLKIHEQRYDLTRTCLVSEHIKSEILDVSSVLSEDSTTSFDEKDDATIKSDDIESSQIGNNVKANMYPSVRECDSSVTEVNFNMRSPVTTEKKKMLDWMKVRRTYGKTTLLRLSNCISINSDQ